MEIIITPDGSAHCVYAEAIDLHALGALTIRRASIVDPDAAGQWRADLTPVGGPELGPFARRSGALDAEQRWLAAQWLGR
jgi:hypothetical protein